MAIDKRAGQPAQQSDLINVAQLTAQYYVLKPEVGNAEHAVKFGTSGHRGSAARHNFNEPHILAIAQAIAEDRAKNGITGPCYVGKDTHALSEPAFISVLEVLTANGVDVIGFVEGEGSKLHLHRRREIVRLPDFPRRGIRHRCRLRCQSPSRRFRPDDAQ